MLYNVIGLHLPIKEKKRKKKTKLKDNQSRVQHKIHQPTVKIQ